MKLTLGQSIDAIIRGETPEQYRKRCQRLRRLANERDDLEDAIKVLEGDPEFEKKLEKKKARLQKVMAEIEKLA